MKLIDGKGRIFGKLSIIDCAIILVLAAVCIGAYLKFGVLEETGTTQLQPIRYTLEITDLRDFVFENLQVGDTLYESEGTDVGTVLTITSRAHTDSIGLLDGTLITVEVPERYAVVVEVASEATVVNGRYYIGKTYEMAAGVSRTFLSKYMSCIGKVKEIGVYGD